MPGKDSARDLAKRDHECRKTSFTKRYNTFQNLLEANVQSCMLEEAYSVMTQVYEALDRSHDEFLSLSQVR